MTNHYLYKINEVYFILHHLSEAKIRSLLALARQRINDDFILKCCDVARAFDFLGYNESRVIAHLFFFKDSPHSLSRTLHIPKEQIFYLKRRGLKQIVQFLNGSN
ncbi:MAG: hypothetical protein IEMM0008_0785 [bacterium]|nr:MAG: hypothetical protein IEMM0008_0785 [bacterium]